MEDGEKQPETSPQPTVEQPAPPVGEPTKKQKPKWIVPAIVVGIFIFGTAIALLFTPCCGDSGKARDAKRIGDLRQVTFALEMYYDDYEKFPENLEELSPKYMTEVPKDPKSGEAYGYVLIKDNEAILKAILDYKNSPSLAEDKDGTISGLDCNDPAYCIIYEIEEIDEFADWKTYRNEEYGFETKYPKNWYVYEDTSRHIIISTFTKDKYDKYYGSFDEHTKLGKNSGVIIGNHPYSETGSMEKWLESAKNSAESFCQTGIKCGETTIEETSIAGRRGYRIYMPYSESQSLYEEGIRITYVFSQKGDEGYSIFSGDFAGEDKEIYEKYVEDFDQIVSTFKFIEADDTADWEVYRNEEYNYEMKYPKDWIVKHSSGYNNDFGIYYESNSFKSPDGSYILFFGIVPSDSKIRTPNLRTGVQAGDFLESDEIVNIGGVSVGFNELVYEGKVKEIFFNSFEINDFKGKAELSYFGDISTQEYDMTGKPELDTVKKILSTFKFLD